MNHLLALPGVITAAPSPSDGFEFTSVSVSPGLGGFIAMFFLAVAVVALIVSMTRHVRRVNAQHVVREQQRSQQQRDAQKGRDQQGLEQPRDDDPDRPRGGDEI